MNRWRAGLTLWDVLATCAIVGTLSIFIGLFTPHWHPGARRKACEKLLEQIGKAVSAYRNDNNGYFPFSWGPGDSAPKAFNNAAAGSLVTLYPGYLKTARMFQCPSTRDKSAFVLKGGGANQTWALTGSSYGYDPRISRVAGKKAVIMADMDGTYAPRFEATATQNHRGGQNVLYVDGSVKWVKNPKGNFAYDNPKDNIFAQDPWDADTDTYLVREDLNDLTISFDGYDHLK